MRPSLHASLACVCRNELLRTYRRKAHVGFCNTRHVSKICSSEKSSPRDSVINPSTSDQQLRSLAAWHHKPRHSHVCPACGQRIQRLHVLERHFRKCCPDLIPLQAWQATNNDQDAIAALLAGAAEAEIQLRKTCIFTAFRQVDDDGQPIKRSPEEVANILDLPVLRW